MSDKSLSLHDPEEHIPGPVHPAPPPPAYPDEWADYGEAPAAGGFSLGRILLALRRFWWLAVLGAVLGAGGAYVAYGLVVPTYTAQASILVTIPSREEQNQGAVQAAALMEETSLLDLLRDRLVTAPVVVEERLYLQRPKEREALFAGFMVDSAGHRPGQYVLRVPEGGGGWQLATSDGPIVETGAAGDSIGETIGFRWAPSADVLVGGTEVSFTVLPVPEAGIELAQRLQASLNRQGNFINVRLSDEDPERAARILNAVIDEFSRVATALKEGELQQTLAELEAQVERTADSVALAQQRLEDFRVQTATEPANRATPVAGGTQETRAPVYDLYEQLGTQVVALEADRRAIQSILDSVPPAPVPISRLEFIPAAARSSELAAALTELTDVRATRNQLLQQFTPEYPDVVRAQERIRNLEGDRIPELLRGLVSALEANVRDLRERQDSVGAELQQIPLRLSQERALEAKLEEFEGLESNLRQRLALRRLAFEGSLEDFDVLSRATTPFLPSSDQRLPLAGAVFLGFIGVGLAGAILLDRFDSHFRYPEDLTRGMGVEVLGMIPRIRGKKTQGEVEEAFRDLRMRLMYAHGTAGPLMVTFASPGPSEGKTLVSANLGLAFAKIGRRTLLIDGDTRRGDLHRLIGGERTPGLVDFLAGTSDGRIINKTEYPNLHFMGAGARLARAPELLAGERIKHLFMRLRERYDVILVDGPPLAVGADAFHLASLAGSMALVVRAGESEKGIVEKKLQALSNLPVRILGGILNDVASSALKGYGYYSYYVPGYEAGEEDVEDLPMLAPGEGEEVQVPE